MMKSILLEFGEFKKELLRLFKMRVLKYNLWGLKQNAFMLEEKLIYHLTWCDIIKLRCIALYQMGLQATLPLKRLAVANSQLKCTACIGTNQ